MFRICYPWLQSNPRPERGALDQICSGTRVRMHEVDPGQDVYRPPGEHKVGSRKAVVVCQGCLFQKVYGETREG